MDTVFKTKPDGNLNNGYFQWRHIPYVERIQWNYLLRRVVEIDTNSNGDTGDYIIDNRSNDDALNSPLSTPCPNFYNQNFCLALTTCPDGSTYHVEKEEFYESLLPRSNDQVSQPSPTTPAVCWDLKMPRDMDYLYPYLVRPYFNYHRKNFEWFHFDNNGGSSTKLNGYSLNSLTIGSLVWLYFYERMGIFKILGALLDDYNYRGKYSLSSQVKNGNLKNRNYIELMEHLSVLTRQGMSSTLRDRVSTYQRVLGVTIQNDLNIQSAENNSFMKNFSKLIGNMLEYYNAKRLSIAIQNNTTQVRSSVATQTAILNTVKVLCQNFEVMEYGRNMIHTFNGIATVYATLCLIRQIRDVIGIPREYDTPEEYVPAAYNILVLKKQGTSSDSNRYTVFDDCASYGYRLLTDVQSADLTSFTLGELNSPFDAWLSSVEEWVEGYNNAFKSIPDKTNAESAVATV